MAEAEGTEVESSEELPPEPATEAQLSYARDLGIKIPANPTKEQLSYLIAQRVESPATRAQLWCLEEYGLSLPPNVFASGERVAGFLSQHLGDQLERELARWYLYGVERYLTRGRWDTPDQSALTRDRVYALADRMVGDPKTLKSLLRELDDYTGGLRFTLPDFSSAQEQGELSIRTTAFQAARSLLTEELGLEERTASRRDASTASRSRSRSGAPKARRSGCFGVILLGISVLGGTVIILKQLL
ncbi:MAG: hypothetical protein ACE5F1_17430 [Planctomycetota bacterium]